MEKDLINIKEKDPDIVALSEAHTKLKGSIDEFKKYIKRLDVDKANMQVAYEELTKKNEDGTYYYNQGIVEDITYKYEQVNAKAEELMGIINKCLDMYKKSYDEVIKYLPKQNYLAEEEKKENTKVEEETYNYTKYTNVDGNIVAVTYGGKNGVASDPYKTFVLNYNFFEVTTTYNDKDYTIPAFGYVIIQH